jgi:DNA uptake protein ComE-like DNA-binding protein
MRARKRVRLPVARTPRRTRRRRGVILLAVLVALVLLALAGYQYADLMQAEYRAADNAHRLIQARAVADSGIYYAAGIVAAPSNIENILGGNIHNNPQYFMDVQVPTGDGSGTFGKFTLLAPADPMSQSPNDHAYGLIDEGAKLNLNVLMQLDPTGQMLYNALMMLPNMTSNVAWSIVDWLDSDNNVSPGGAEDDYYMSLSPPYHCKNGPLESLEELLLVQGVTPQLLFGGDLNRNGIIDGNEDSGLGLGWAQFLTVASREANSDSSGNPYNYLNSSDLQDLYQNISLQVDPNLAAFIILYRQNGGTTGGATTSITTTPGGATTSTKSGGKTSGGSTSNNKGGTGSNNSSKTSAPSTDLSSVSLDFTKQAKTKISSMWALVNAQVTVPGANGQPSVTYACPLSDPNQQPNLLPLFFSTCTLSPSNEIPARININTAPQEVLAALQGILNPSMVSAMTGNSTGGTSGSGSSSSSSSSSTSNNSTGSSGTGSATYLQDGDIQTILSTRPSYSTGNPSDPTFQSPAWLLLQANLPLSTLQKLEPYITTRTQVYRVQSVGYVDERGPAVRVEAIIDTNGGRPRIYGWRDLTPLGKGWERPE